MWQGFFAGKKITVMGLGLLGRAVGDAVFLAEQGAELIVTDTKSETDLAESVAKLKKFPNVTFRLGGHDLADFRDRDFILMAAGVPQNSPFIGEARKNKIPIKMSASWFAELAEIPIVGVTGTRGKSTTTMMLYDIMRAVGMQVLLGGNVRGVSTLALLSQVTKDSIGLFELDSWQCQGFGEIKLSPQVAVFTSFMDDHLNYYGGDRHAYLFDKAQLFLYQKPEDTLVVSDQALPQLAEFKHVVRSHVSVARANKLELAVPGEHNQLNAACALEAARALGIDDEVSLAALKNFKGVPGRLELVREVGGVKFYNDTTATTPDATLAALDALGTHKTILIMGGADKTLDMSRLVAELPKVKKIVLLAGSGTDKLMPQLKNYDISMHHNLQKAFEDARAAASAGDIVLFSPAFASFGMFKNEFDRGDQFNALVQTL